MCLRLEPEAWYGGEAAVSPSQAQLQVGVRWLEVTQSTQTVGLPGIRGFIVFKEKLDPLTTGMCRGLLFMAEVSPVLFASIFLHAEQSQGRGCPLSQRSAWDCRQGQECPAILGNNTKDPLASGRSREHPGFHRWLVTETRPRRPNWWCQW